MAQASSQEIHFGTGHIGEDTSLGLITVDTNAPYLVLLKYSMWKFISELAHMLVWGLTPNFSHHDLGCIWGSNSDAGHFVMA